MARRNPLQSSRCRSGLSRAEGVRVRRAVSTQVPGFWERAEFFCAESVALSHSGGDAPSSRRALEEGSRARSDLSMQAASAPVRLTVVDGRIRGERRGVKLKLL